MGEYQDNSLGSRVFQRLREDILSGKYKEHDELRENTLGKELGVSRTPVREALRQLELEGLVTIIPNKGAYVTGISSKDIRDIYILRSMLEGLCARWATEHITEEQLEELELPGSIVRVGRYCLYNCDHLRKLTFTGQLADWGTGVFTGCHHICEVVLTTDASGTSTLKDMLDEVHEALHVRWNDTSQQIAELMYPEFYEEGVENTPARILETHVHGSGMRYRNCFEGRRIDFTQYDRLFPYAVAQEPERLLVRLVCGRLRFPHALGRQAREQYETYLRENPQLFAAYFTELRDMDGIRWYCEGPGFGHESAVLDFLDALTERAGRVGFAEALGYAMEYRHVHGKKPEVKRRFEL